MADVTKDMSHICFLKQLLEALQRNLKGLKWFWILSCTKLHVVSSLHHENVSPTYSNLLINIYPLLDLDFFYYYLVLNQQICSDHRKSDRAGWRPAS